MCILMLIAVFAPAACAAEPGKIDIQVQNASLADIIAQLSSQAGVSIIDSEVKGNITASLNGVELSQAPRR